MPKVDPFQYLMAAIGTLTGGLITDLQTLFLGLLVCSFILMGLDLLKDALISSIGQLGSSPGEIIANYRINRRIAAAASSEYSAAPASRNDIEISPLRQYDLETASGDLSSLAPENVYDRSDWSRDGIELSEDRYSSLEEAMDTAVLHESIRNDAKDSRGLY